MKLHCFVITLISALSVLGVFACANPIVGGMSTKIETRDTINGVLENAFSGEFEPYLLKRRDDDSIDSITHTETLTTEATATAKRPHPTTANSDKSIIDDNVIDQEETTIHHVVVILCSLGASLVVIAIGMACLYLKVRRQQKKLDNVKKEVGLDDGESGNRDDGCGGFWNKGERTANNSTSAIERGRALSGAEPRVSNQMNDNDNRQSATEMETHSDISDIQVQPSSTAISDEKSASITPLPAAITTNSSVTVYSSTILQRQQQAFPPAFTTPPATPSAPMAAELVSNSERDENTKIDFAEKEDVLNMSDETNDISNGTGITNRSISPFDSLRQDQLDDLGFYSELPTISPPAYTPTAPPICNLPYGPIQGYDRHRLQDMVLYTSAPPRRRPDATLTDNNNNNHNHNNTHTRRSSNPGQISTANTRESSETTYPSPPPPILSRSIARTSQSSIEDNR